MNDRLNFLRSFLPAFIGMAMTMALSPVPGSALEAPRLLADIVPGNSADAQLSSAGGFIRLGDRLIFSTLGATPQDDAILWSTDGTAAGTVELTSKICPLDCTAIRPLGTVGGVALLAATSGVWRTDGTPAGTFPITNRLDSTGETAKLSPRSRMLFFTACGPVLGCELWESDGSRAGTHIVKDIVPGSDGSDPHGLTPFHGKLYFLAGGETLADTGLWSSDGTAAGTRFVAPSVNDSVNGDTVLGATASRLFFNSLNGTEQLFASDGTPRGTRLVRRFTPPPCAEPDLCAGPYLSFLEPAGDEMIFTASDGVHGAQFWTSDGSRGGTRPLTNVRAGLLGAASIPQRLGKRWIFSAPQRAGGPAVLWAADGDFAPVGPVTGCQGGCPQVLFFFPPPASTPAPSRLLFVGTDPAHGAEVWATDGTGAGTRRLSDICPGACSAFVDEGPDVVLGDAAGRTYFLAQPGTADTPQDLWVSDGTPAGTRKVSGYARGIGVLGTEVYYSADEADGLELQATDGTAAGSHTVTVLQGDPAGSFPIISPLGNLAVIMTSEGDVQRLWRSDGTPAGTSPIPGFALNVPKAHFGNVPSIADGSNLFFEVDLDVGGGAGTPSNNLWRTDGTGPGTFQLTAFGPGQALRLSVRTEWNGELLFVASQASSCAFWTSDGTVAGTRELLPMPAGVDCPDGVVTFGSGFLFVAQVEAGGQSVPQLFLSDGTAAGTRQLSSVQQTRFSIDPEFARIGGEVFFQISDPSGEDVEFWQTDGTPAGTQPFFPGLLPQAFGLTAWNGALYLSADTGDDGQPALVRWAPGGPAPVTLAMVDLGFNSAFSPQIPPFVPAGNLLFFAARDQVHGFELWATDGTAAGTRMVRDILPGPLPSSPRSLTAAGSLLFFSADDGEHGRELWVSDGTAAGTRLVADLNPGGFSSRPSSLAVAGGNLFFAADDGTTGLEPWALPLP
jgi:ELWxxDGT repeat protein